MDRRYDLKGHYIKRFDETIVVRHKGRARYAWSAGQAVSRFLEELKNGRLIGRKCRGCDRILIPPRMYCEYCFRPTDEWVYVEPVGKVTSAVVSYIAATRERLEKPQIIAIIEFEGTGGSGIFHFLENVSPDEVINRRVFGMRVKAVWKPAEERTGSITDIKYFIPVEGGGSK